MGRGFDEPPQREFFWNIPPVDAPPIDWAGGRRVDADPWREGWLGSPRRNEADAKFHRALGPLHKLRYKRWQRRLHLSYGLNSVAVVHGTLEPGGRLKRRRINDDPARGPNPPLMPPDAAPAPAGWPPRTPQHRSSTTPGRPGITPGRPSPLRARHGPLARPPAGRDAPRAP